jgi:UPF0271 protein
VRGIDLNADLGEGGAQDAGLLGIVTSANVACGLHAGDWRLMDATFRAAALRGVAIGAHPGLDDRANFGRLPMRLSEAEITALVAYQVGAARGVAAAAGLRLGHVKAHGALYNLAATDAGVARAVARGIAAVDRGLVCLALAGSVALRAAQDEGLAVAAEVFADRAVLPDGTLAPRDRPGAVLHDAATIARRMAGLVATGRLAATDGTPLALRFDSICIHGDTPGALAIARHLRAVLEQAGTVLRPFAP